MPPFQGPQGLRVRVEGRRSLKDVRECLNHLLDYLSELGVDELTGVNLYVHPYAAGAHFEITGEDGNTLQQLNYPMPVKRVVVNSTKPKRGKRPPIRLAVDNDPPKP